MTPKKTVHHYEGGDVLSSITKADSSLWWDAAVLAACVRVGAP
jgi:hypothetical protein